MIRWTQGAEKIETMLDEGRLVRRPGTDTAMNHAAFEDLERKFTSMEALLRLGDYDAVVIMAHEVTRKALTCILREQGLEVPANVPGGHHKAVEEAALAQFGRDERVLGPYRHEIRALRLERNDTEYTSELLEIGADDATGACSTARGVHGAIEPLLGSLRLF